MTRSSPGTSCRTSYVYASLRPRKDATNATWEPIASGGSVFHSTLSMFSYHSGAFAGSAE
jgi:hypothetical protein